MHKSQIVHYMLLFAAAALVNGCGRSFDEEVVIISPHSPEIRDEFTTGFSKWYYNKTGKKVIIKWLDVGGTGESIEYIRSRNADEKQAGGVDIFLVEEIFLS